jgi:hypothetical protein
VASFSCKRLSTCLTPHSTGRGPSLPGHYPASPLSGRRRRPEGLTSVRRSNGSYGFPVSRFHEEHARVRAIEGIMATRTLQPQLAPQPSSGILLSPVVPPPLVPVRPDPSCDPAVELVEEFPYVGTSVVPAPSANHRVDVADQLCSRDRHPPSCQGTDLLLEPLTRLLAGLRLETALPSPRLDPVLWQPQRLLALPYHVAQELEALVNMDDPGLPRMQHHTQSLQDPTRRSQHPLRFPPAGTRHHPVIGVARQLVPPYSHLPIKRRQQNVPQGGKLPHPVGSLVSSV